MESWSVSLRDLPSVERILQSEAAAVLVATYGRPLTLEAIRDRLDAARDAIREGESPPKEDVLIEGAHKTLERWLAPTLQPVINATGVIIHTNLGRAPLSKAARGAMIDVAESYSTLEYNLERGARGKREHHIEDLLTRLTNAEAALVVNNNAAAVLLALTSLARRKEVIVSRSQLIEIGGGFRIPDIMK
jgi:L-seryl-tRNA(Ser) seleniumtransferase